MERIPFVVRNGKLVFKGTVHQHDALEQGRNFRIHRKEQSQIGHRSDGQQRNLTGIPADGIAHEFEVSAHAELRFVRPVGKPIRLRRGGLFDVGQHWDGRAGEDGNVLAARDLEQCADHHCALFRLAGNRRDTKKVALFLHQQVGESDAVVNIGTNIGVEDHFFFCHVKIPPCWLVL